MDHANPDASHMGKWSRAPAAWLRSKQGLAVGICSASRFNPLARFQKAKGRSARVVALHLPPAHLFPLSFFVNAGPFLQCNLFIGFQILST